MKTSDSITICFRFLSSRMALSLVWGNKWILQRVTITNMEPSYLQVTFSRKSHTNLWEIILILYFNHYYKGRFIRKHTTRITHFVEKKSNFSKHTLETVNVSTFILTVSITNIGINFAFEACILFQFIIHEKIKILNMYFNFYMDGIDNIDMRYYLLILPLKHLLQFIYHGKYP